MTAYFVCELYIPKMLYAIQPVAALPRAPRSGHISTVAKIATVAQYFLVLVVIGLICELESFLKCLYQIFDLCFV